MKRYYIWGIKAALSLSAGVGFTVSTFAETRSVEPGQQLAYAEHVPEQTSPEQVSFEPETPKKSEFILSPIPNAIEALPTVLPPDSNKKIVKPEEETRDSTWADERHNRLREYLKQQAERIDDWFGEPDPLKPARASIRILLDSNWDKYDDVEVKPRIRGKIKLPTLEKRFSLVFGDDSLDDEIRGNVAITNANPPSDPKKTIDQRAARRENNSLALRFSEWLKTDLFDTDFDVGLRNGAKDVYGRLKISRDWQLADDFSTRAEQVYRYGSSSKNYARTNLEIRHQRDSKPFIADQFAITYADKDSDIGISWENRLFRQHQFFHDNTFSYGLYTGGRAKDKDFHLNGYGPFVSWRQPFLREWFFVQSDLNYYNDKDMDRNHYLSAFLRLEAVF
ncbi:hypothetical protein ACF3NA_09275 [Alkanindiges sp. WGS2144]|uniref:hypothetical protein n=1 Tax=Alkanindiges sp. WGS2144 TaxID=3366808 RepID=UPI003752D182